MYVHTRFLQSTMYTLLGLGQACADPGLFTRGVPTDSKFWQKAYLAILRVSREPEGVRWLFLSYQGGPTDSREGVLPSTVSNQEGVILPFLPYQRGFKRLEMGLTANLPYQCVFIAYQRGSNRFEKGSNVFLPYQRGSLQVLECI